jgi:hypothetical protein
MARAGKLGRAYIEFGEAVLRGDRRIRDIDGDDRCNLIWIQEYVTLNAFSENKATKKWTRSEAIMTSEDEWWERNCHGDPE